MCVYVCIYIYIYREREICMNGKYVYKYVFGYSHSSICDRERYACKRTQGLEEFENARIGRRRPLSLLLLLVL